VTLEPVELVQERVCHFKAKPLECRVCKAERPRSSKKGPCPACGSTKAAMQRQGCARCGANKGDRAHFGAPPSFNVLASGQGSGNAMVYANLKKAWEDILAELLEASALPKGLGRVMVEGEITFPDRRTDRDQGNFRVILEKALGDALERGGWLERDDWIRYEFGGLAQRYERGVSRTRLMLFPVAAIDVGVESDLALFSDAT
jgi:hypothetical protein